MKDLKEKILKEYNNGNIVIYDSCGLQIYKIQDIVNQPTEGLLYDLNRDEATILTFIDDPKWINDFACAKVIEYLKNILDKKQ